MEGEAEAVLGAEEVTGVVAGAEEVIGEEDEEGVAEGTEEEAVPCVTGEGVETDSTHTEEVVVVVVAAADMVLLSCSFQNTL